MRKKGCIQWAGATWNFHSFCILSIGVLCSHIVDRKVVHEVPSPVLHTVAKASTALVRIRILVVLFDRLYRRIHSISDIFRLPPEVQ